jgi:hypothetical protein
VYIRWNLHWYPEDSTPVPLQNHYNPMANLWNVRGFAAEFSAAAWSSGQTTGTMKIAVENRCFEAGMQTGPALAPAEPVILGWNEII